MGRVLARPAVVENHVALLFERGGDGRLEAVRLPCRRSVAKIVGLRDVLVPHIHAQPEGAVLPPARVVDNALHVFPRLLRPGILAREYIHESAHACPPRVLVALDKRPHHALGVGFEPLEHRLPRFFFDLRAQARNVFGFEKQARLGLCVQTGRRRNQKHKECRTPNDRRQRGKKGVSHKLPIVRIARRPRNPESCSEKSCFLASGAAFAGLQLGGLGTWRVEPGREGRLSFAGITNNWQRLLRGTRVCLLRAVGKYCAVPVPQIVGMVGKMR